MVEVFLSGVSFCNSLSNVLKLNVSKLLFHFSQEQLSLDSRLETLCQSFISHNLSTGNFGSLINVYLVKVSELLALSDAER